MSGSQVLFFTDLETTSPPIAVGTGAVADVALLRVAGYRGILHIEGVVGQAGSLIKLDIAGSAQKDGIAQLLASSAALPSSDFAGVNYRKPGNSASPETTAASGAFWIDLLIDGLSDVVIRVAAASATTLTITARVAERSRVF